MSRAHAAPGKVVVLIDGGCPMCRALSRRLRRIDWLGRLSFEDARDERVRARLAPGLDEATAMTAMHVIAPDGSRTWGYDGFTTLGRVIPLLWLPSQLGRLPGIRHLGRSVYAFVAARRTREGGCNDTVCAR